MVNPYTICRALDSGWPRSNDLDDGDGPLQRRAMAGRDWQSLFDHNELVFKQRRRFAVSKSRSEGDGGFAVVDIDLRVRRHSNGIRRIGGRPCPARSMPVATTAGR